MRTYLLRCILLAAIPIVALAGPPSLQEKSEAAKAYDLATREAQYRALLAMPNVDVEYGNFGRVSLVQGSTGLFVSDMHRFAPGDSADAVLRTLGPLLMSPNSGQLRVQALQKLDMIGGGRDVFLDQSIDGIAVIDGGVNIRTSRDGEIIVISSRFVPRGKASREPKLSLRVAKEKLNETLVAGGLAVRGSVTSADQGSLAYWTDQGKEEQPVLVWLIRASFLTPLDEREIATAGVDAATGDVRYLIREYFELNRTAYSMHGLPDPKFAIDNGGLIHLWNEGSPDSVLDPQAYAAYHLVEKARNTWVPIGWNYDTMSIVAHWGDTNNAAYTQNIGGLRYLIFGDGMAADQDAVAHEYGHGIFASRAPNAPSAWFSEYFAVNEFYGDLSAVMTDARDRSGLAVPDTWRISWMNLRDLGYPKSPLVHNYVSQNYRDWYGNRRFCCSQRSAAYSNATIYGHALYLMKQGGTHSRVGQSVPGGVIPAIVVPPVLPWQTELLQAVFALGLNELKLFNQDVNGVSLKYATINAANALSGPVLATTVDHAWTAVGVGNGCTAPPLTPIPTVNSAYCKGRYTITWPQLPGVTYHGQVVPQHFGWDSFGQTSVDGPVASCNTNVPETARFRLRACNGCGCSNWSVDEWLYYYSPCL